MNGLLISTLVALILSHIIAFGFGWLLACEQFRPAASSERTEADYGDFPSVTELFHNGTNNR